MIYSAPTRMRSLRARRTHQPIQWLDQGEMFLPAAGDKIVGSNADARVGSQIAATLSSGTQVSQ